MKHNERDNIKEQNSQQDNQGVGGEPEKKGDYVMIVSEMMRVLYDGRIVKLSGDEKSVLLFLIHKTIGQHCKLRQFTSLEIMEGTGISRRMILYALKSLVAKQLLKKEKKKGNRTPFYGPNTDFFGRVYPWEIPNVYYMDKFRKCNSNDSESASSKHFESAAQCTPVVKEKSEKQNNVRHLQKSSKSLHISPHIFLHISISEFSNFLKSRSRNTQKRWIDLVVRILKDHPGDQALLWMAIELMHKTQKDLYGVPIQRSILALMEKSDWEIMKKTLIARMDQIRKSQEIEETKRQNELLLEATRRQLEQQESESNTPNLSEKEKAIQKIRTLPGLENFHASQ